MLGYEPISINEDHVNMTKFATSESPGYVSVLGELDRWVKNLDYKQSQASKPSKLSKPSKPSNVNQNYLNSRNLIELLTQHSRTNPRTVVYTIMGTMVAKRL